ncbi:MAG TPA: hypothetical protein VLK34_05090 [Nocardioidaceae bacterium]|nr:hypothetical protein [Nocardioidaceae bacterium]
MIQLRHLVSLATGKAESPGESWIRLAIYDANLPAPLVQVTVMVEGREFRLDLAYPKHRVCIEYDGEEFHSTLEQRAHDEARRELLRRHKWTVIVVTKADLDRAGISRWTREIRDALGR